MGKAWRPHRPCSVVPAEAGAAPAADASTQSDPVRAGVLDELSNAQGSARAALTNFLDLISLEARRAGLALMWMVAWGSVAAICIVAAWLGLMTALAMSAVALGLPLLAAVIAVAAINLVGGVMLIYVCIRTSQGLLFSATRRQAAGESSHPATRVVMRAPTLAAIDAAELRVVQAKQHTRDSLCRGRVALRATLARPATLALVAGTAGSLSYWLARRPRQQAAPSSHGVAGAATTSAVGLVLAFVVRYGMQHLPFILQQVRAARQKRVA